jgi:tetratricopeptide (TPR) repeat protein
MLNVDAVLEGSIQRAGDRVRISVQLIHAPTDTHLWARDYERGLADVLALQAEVARAVAEEIQIQVTAEDRARLESGGRVNPAAYQEYLLGQHYLWKFNEEDLARAIDHFERSAVLDPTYAATYAALSHAWWWRGVWGAKTRQEVESSSRAAAARALELDPQRAEAHVSSGRIKFGYDLDWAGADRDFTRALEIDPNNVDAHFFSAMLCMALGCFAESIAHMKRVEQLDPLSPIVPSFFGRVLYRARRFDEAIDHLNRAIALAPQNPAGAYHRLSEVYEQMGRHTEALALLDKSASVEDPASRHDGTHVDNLVLRARILARMGKRKEARAILAASRGHNPQLLATVYAALGDRDEAFRLLFRAIEEPRGLPVYIKTDPPFDSLHADPRWAAVLSRMNYPSDRELPRQGETAARD